MRLRGELTGSQLVGALIILVTTVVVMALVFNLGSLYTAQDAQCGEAVQRAALTNKLYGREGAQAITACQTKETTLSVKELGSTKEAQEAAMKETVAKALYTCYRNWGKGELDLFNSPGEYCTVCERITFDTTDIESKDQPTITAFNKYLQTANSPSGETYEAYLQGYTTPESELAATNQRLYSLDPQNTITVVFWYNKQKREQHLFEVLRITDDYTPTDAAAVGGMLGFALETLVSARVGATGGSAAGERLGIQMITPAENQLIKAGFDVVSATDRVTLYAARGAREGAVAGGIGGLGSASMLGSKLALLAYIRERARDDFNVESATFLISDTPEATRLYEERCTNAASVTQSP